MIVIRPATTDDINDIVRIHIDSWNAQFREFLTPEQVLLKNLDEQFQQELWQGRFDHEEQSTRYTFIAQSNRISVAYITGTADKTSYNSELHQIYVLPDYKQQGIGANLVSELASKLQAIKQNSLFVWVMTINPSVAFYRDKLSGIFTGERIIPEGDGILREAKYAWSDLEALIK